MNALTYIKNVGKSFGYTIADTAAELNPAIKSAIDTNKDFAKEMFEYVKDYKSTVSKIKGSITSSQYWALGEEAISNTFEDLKNGTWYNKERKDKIENEIANSMMGGGEFDFDDSFDFDDGDSSGADDVDFDDDGWDDRVDDLEDMMDTVGDKVTTGVAEATIKSSEIIVENNKNIAKKSAMFQSAMFGKVNAGIAALNSNVAALIPIGEQLNTHIQNSTTFYTKMSELTEKQTNLLEQIAKNTAPVEKKKDSGSNRKTVNDVLDAEGILDLSQYMEAVKANINDMTSTLTSLGDMFGDSEDGKPSGFLRSLVASPMEYILSSFVKDAVPRATKKAMTDFNNVISGIASTLFLNLRENMFSGDWKEKISNIFGISSNYKDTLSTSNYNKGKVDFDGITRKAIVDVIPTYLSKIYSAVSGKEETRFDYSSGKYIGRREIEENKKRILRSEAMNAGTDMQEMFEEFARRNTKTNEEFVEMRNMFQTFLEKSIEKGQKYNPVDVGAANDELGLDGAMGNLIEEFLNGLAKDNKGKKLGLLLNLNRNILYGRENITRRFQNMENEGGNAISYLYDNSFEKDEKGNFKDAIGDTSALNIANIYDKYHNNVFYYLQKITQYSGAILNTINNGIGGGSSSRSLFDPITGAINLGPSSLSDIALPEIEDNSAAAKPKATKVVRELPTDEEFERLINPLRKDREFNYKLNKLIEKYGEYSSLADSDSKKKELVNKVKNLAEDLKKKNKERQEKKGLFERMKESNTVPGKIKEVLNSIDQLVETPARLVTNITDSATISIRNILYGKDETSEDKGFLGMIFQKTRDMFDNMNLWINEHILNPLTEKFNINSVGDLFKHVFGIFGVDIDSLVQKAESLMTTGGFKDKLRFIKDETAENFKNVGKWTKMVHRNVWGDVKTLFTDGAEFTPETMSNDNTVTDTRSYDTVKKKKPKTVNEQISELEARIANGGELPEEKKEGAQAARGGQVTKGGMIAVSEGELIIPSEYNPFYTKATNKAAQIRKENDVVNKFYGKFAKGGTVGEDNQKGLVKSMSDAVLDALKRFTHSKEAETFSTKKDEEGSSDDSEAASHDDGSITDKAKKAVKKKAKKAVKDKIDEMKDQSGHFLKDILNDGVEERVDKNGNKYYVKNGRRIKKEAAFHKESYHKELNDGVEEKTDKNGNKYYIKDGKRIKVSESFHDVKDKTLKETKFGKFLNESSKELRGGIKTALFGGEIKDEDGKVIGHRQGIFGDGKSESDTLKKIKKESPRWMKEMGVPENISGMITGGLIGAGASLFTGGLIGPLVGGAIGAGAGLIIKSKTIQKALFGDDKEDGLLPQEVSSFVKNKLPKIAGYGAVGALASLIPGIPGGPVAGLIIGSAAGFAMQNDEVQDALFGEKDKDGNRTIGGLMNKEFRDKVKKTLPRMGAGALAGLVAGPFGLAGNLIAGAALGYASTTEKFQDIVFGEKDSNGDRSGGLIGWIRKDLFEPVKSALQPIAHSFLNIAKSMTRGFHKFVYNLFKETLGIPLYKLIAERLSKSFFGKLVGGLVGGALGLGKKVISAPFKMVGGVGRKIRTSQIRRGTADYMTANERIRYRNEHNLGTDDYSTFDEELQNRTASDIENIRSQIKGSKSDMVKRQEDAKKYLHSGSKSLMSGDNALSATETKDIMSRIKDAKSDDDLEEVRKYAESKYSGEKLSKINDIIDKQGKSFIATHNDMSENSKNLAKSMKEKFGIDINERNIDKIDDMLKHEAKIKSKMTPEEQAALENKQFHDKVTEKTSKITELLTEIKFAITGENKKNGGVAEKDVENKEALYNTENAVGNGEYNTEGLSYGTASNMAADMYTNALGDTTSDAMAFGYDNEYVSFAADKASKARKAVKNDSKEMTRTEILANGETAKYVRDKNGDWTPDTGDNQTKETFENLQKERDNQTKIADTVGTIGTGVGSLIGKLFGNKDGEDDEKDSIFSKLFEGIGNFGSNLLSGIKDELGLFFGKGGVFGSVLKGVVGPALFVAAFSGKFDNIANNISSIFDHESKSSKKGQYTKSTTATGMDEDGNPVQLKVDENGVVQTDENGNMIDITGRPIEGKVTDVQVQSTGKTFGQRIREQTGRALLTGRKGLVNRVIDKSKKNFAKAADKLDKSLLGRASKKIANSKLVQSAASKVKDVTGKTAGKIASKLADTKLGKKVLSTEVGKNMSKAWANGLTAKTTAEVGASTLFDKLKDKLGGIAKALTKVPFISKYTKVLQPIMDKILDAVKKAAATKGGKMVGNLVSKLGGPLNVAVLIADFISGFQDARTTFGITEDPTFVQKLMSGLLKAINNAIPFIGGLIPEKTLVNIFLDTIGKFFPNLTKGLREQQARAQEEVDAYNQEHGTNLNIEEYNKQVMGHYTWGEKIGNSVKTGWSKVKGFFGGNKSEEETTDESQEAAAGSGMMLSAEKPKSIFTSILKATPQYKLLQKGKDSVTSYLEKHPKIASMLESTPQYKLFKAGKDLGSDLYNAFSEKGLSGIFDEAKGNASRILNDSKLKPLLNILTSSSPLASAFINKLGSYEDNATATDGTDLYSTLTEKGLSGITDDLKSSASKSFNESKIKPLLSVLTSGSPLASIFLNKLGSYDSSTTSTDESSLFSTLKAKGLSGITADAKGAASKALKDSKLGPLLNVLVSGSPLASAFINKLGSYSYSGLAAGGSDMQSTSVGSEQYQTAQALDTISNTVGNIGSTFDSSGKSYEIFSKAVNQLQKDSDNDDDIESMMKGTIATNPNDPMSSIFSTSYQFVKAFQVMKSLITKISSPASALIGGIGTITDSIKSTINDDLEGDTGTAGSIWQSIKSKAKGAVSKIGSGIKNFFGFGSGITDENAAAGSGMSTFVSQLDPRFASQKLGKGNVASLGCGPAVASMAVSSLGAGGNMQSAINTAKKYQTKGGTSADYFSDYYRQNGYNAKYYNNSSDINSSISHGPTVLMGKDSSNTSKAKSPFGPKNHYVLAKGFDKSGNVIVDDPESSSGNKRYSKNILKSVKLGIGAGASGIGSSAQDVWNALDALGYSDVAKAGIMGVWQNESGNDSSKLEGYYLGSYPGFDKVTSNSESMNKFVTGTLFPAYAKSNININKNAYLGSDGNYYPGFGLAQWTGPRAYNLKEYAKSKGKDWRNLDGQIAFFQSEMESGKRGVTPDSMNSTTNTDEAAKLFANKFEGTNISSWVKKRQDSARAIFNQFGNGENSTSTGTDTTSNSEQTSESSTNNSSSSTSSSESSSLGNIFTNFSGIMGKLASSFFGKNIASLFGFSTDDDTEEVSETVSTSTDASSSDDEDEKTTSVSDTNVQGYSYKGTTPVDYMKSVLGKLKYSMDGPRNPEQGSADCSSTVSWAVKKATNGAVNLDGNTQSQWSNPNLKTVWFNDGKTPSSIPEGLQPNDLVFYTRPNSDFTKGRKYRLGHVELYEGNGKTIGHGKDNGPTEKALDLKTAIKFARVIDPKTSQAYDYNNAANQNEDNSTGDAASGSGLVNGYAAAKRATARRTPSKIVNFRAAGSGMNSLANQQVRNNAAMAVSKLSGGASMDSAEFIKLIKAIITLLQTMSDNSNKINTIVELLTNYFNAKTGNKSNNNSTTNNSNTTIINNNSGSNDDLDKATSDLVAYLNKLAAG